MKVEKFKNPLMFWLPTGTSCRNLAILKIYLFMDLSLKSGFFQNLISGINLIVPLRKKRQRKTAPSESMVK